MYKRIFFIALMCLQISIAGNTHASDAETAPKAPYESVKDRASRSITEMLYGTAEGRGGDPCVNTPEKPEYSCPQKAQGLPEKGITRMINGVWELATFWVQQPSAESKKDNE